MEILKITNKPLDLRVIWGGAKPKEKEMADEKKVKCDCGKWNGAHASAANTVYCFGLVGSLVYFLQHANSFNTVLMGILKAIFWPGFLIYRLLEFLQM